MILNYRELLPTPKKQLDISLQGYLVSEEPVDYQDRIAQKMTEAPKDFRFVGYSPELAYSFGIEAGRKEAIDWMLEIIDKHAGHGGNDDYCDGYDVACLDIKQAIMDLKGGEE